MNQVFVLDDQRFQVVLEWLVAKVAMNEIVGVNAHHGIQLLLEHLVGQSGPSVAQELAVEGKEDASHDVVDPASNNVSSAVGGPKLFEHATAGMKDTAVVSVVAKGTGVPSWHSGVPVKRVGGHAHVQPPGVG